MFSLSLSLSLVLVASQGPPTSPPVPCLARRPRCHRSAPSTGRHSASHRVRRAMSRRFPAPRGINAKGSMPSGEPCPLPDAKDTSCQLRPCCALARAEPPSRFPHALFTRNRCFHGFSFPPSSPVDEPAKLNLSHASAERNNLLSTAATLPKSKKWGYTEITSLLSRATDVPALKQLLL